MGGGRAAVFTVTGEDLLAAGRRILERGPGRWGQVTRFLPGLDESVIDPERRYRIVTDGGWSIAQFGTGEQGRLTEVDLADVTVMEAVERRR